MSRPLYHWATSPRKWCNRTWFYVTPTRCWNQSPTDINQGCHYTDKRNPSDSSVCLSPESPDHPKVFYPLGHSASSLKTAYSYSLGTAQMMTRGMAADMFLYWCVSSGRTRTKSPFLSHIPDLWQWQLRCLQKRNLCVRMDAREKAYDLRALL